MLLDLIYREPPCGEPDSRPWFVSRVHYMYFALISFSTSGIIMIVISIICSFQHKRLSFFRKRSGEEEPRHACEHEEQEALTRLTYWGVWRRHRHSEHSSIQLVGVTAIDGKSDEAKMDDLTDTSCTRMKLAELQARSSSLQACENIAAQDCKQEKELMTTVEANHIGDKVVVARGATDSGAKPSANHRHITFETCPSVPEAFSAANASGGDTKNFLFNGKFQPELSQEESDSWTPVGAMAETWRRIVNGALKTGGVSFSNPLEGK
ncbi:unnamed protein product [Protopolystoma xenopodis]|uniref:Uncharacterized protein n=1 Tax=Protopolystoma xenopodis TaxID=117903 RepID=A0A3S5AG93_9PLAT|nr:unnamed protein product [Protopolystoma xenopodis]